MKQFRGLGKCYYFLINFVLLVFSLSFLMPVIWLIYSSLKPASEFSQSIIALPKNPSFENYVYVFANGRFTSFFINSTRNTVLSVVLIILFGYIVGYFISRLQFRGRKAIYLLFIAGMLLPVHALIVPMYILFKQFSLTNSWFTILLPNVAFGMPVALLLVSSYIKGIPTELEAAAAIDGSGFIRTMFSIIMPVARPVLITIGVMQYFSCWNEFIFSLILLNDTYLMPLSVGINLLKGEWTTDYTRIMAIMTAAIAPAIIVYFSLSKYIIKGVVAGAVKG